MNVRILARVITYHGERVLLVKNRGMDFWYAPGGQWQHEEENIIQAATREVKEETGLDVKILRLLYLQEFHATPDTIFFETFWLAQPLSNDHLNSKHMDLDPNGQVESAKWFSREELQMLKVFPKRLKNTFWENIDEIINEEDPFIGVS